ncbi:hypothetical protein O6H91_21G068600 [Diphasiastrum complanatum]|uniref:Uncharacterized protein n=1 Tax=Diphasiastrum complanatum TaxID=34168 RepID=A0ACC2ALJ2_DIPCM|nr:hypothetical protein O6H91_21G068600 [Diphasiastrum complanatum]
MSKWLPFFQDWFYFKVNISKRVNLVLQYIVNFLSPTTRGLLHSTLQMQTYKRTKIRLHVHVKEWSNGHFVSTSKKSIIQTVVLVSEYGRIIGAYNTNRCV